MEFCSRGDLRKGLASSIYMKTESSIETLNQRILSSRMKPGR
ncbi:hypothetical protein L345_02622 [Ophiophagus hannah]|uniref:Uncharacterized protein n=1 Tax=Ophiophagus hannah TaxID=8665 RepID=V8PAJ3_OPHHA|nr:hypothetical protein L345_02622 [Ophiophagus hannah]